MAYVELTSGVFIDVAAETITCGTVEIAIAPERSNDNIFFVFIKYSSLNFCGSALSYSPTVQSLFIS